MLGSPITQVKPCHPGGIVSEGPPDAQVMFVSIGPGYEEQKEKRPFVGSSGRLLQDILRAIGYKREDVWLTNICCDHLGDDEDAAHRCHTRLAHELATVKPKLIVPLGKYATEMLTAQWVYNMPNVASSVYIAKPGRSIGKVRGQPLWYEDIYGSGHSARIMPTWQPAAALGEGGASYLQDIIRDLAKLCPAPIGVDLLRWSRDHGKFDWTLPTNAGQFMYCLNSLRTDYPVSIDIETGNSDNIEEMTMDVYKEKLLCFALGQTVGAHTWSFTITPTFYDAFVAWFDLRGADYQWLTHYGFFDMQGIRELLGIKLAVTRDSLSGSHGLDERAGYHRLKTGAREYIGCDPWETFIEEDLTRIKSQDKFKARLRPPEEWTAKEAMLDEDIDLFLGALDSNGRVKEELAGDDLWALWQLFKKNWHHSRATMKDPQYLEAYELRLLEIDGYGFEKLDPQKLYKYNGEDAARTAQWDALQQPALADDGLADYYRAISIPDLNVNTEIAYAGIPIDLNVRDQLKAQWQPIADRMEQALQEQARELGYENDDGSPINLASWKQKGKLFYDIMSLTLPNMKTARTKTGAPSTNIKVLEEMKDQTDFIPKMIAWSHANHQLGSYINPMPNFVRNYQEEANFGINHPVYKPHATRTNRGAYSNPPWHQFPKYVQFDAEPEFEGDDPFHAGKDALRRMVVPWLLQADGTIDKERYIFVEADLKFAEQYANAYMSKDLKFLEDIRSGDLHEAAARNIYKLDRQSWPVWADVPEAGKKRREGKVLNFGVAYDMKEVSLGQMLKVSTYTAKMMLDNYWDGYPDFRDWSKAIKFEAMKSGRVVAPSGRVRHFGLIIGEDSHHELAQASNFPAQNTVTDSMKMSKAQLHLGGKARREQGADYLYTDGLFDTPALSAFDSRILFDIHDMLGFMVRIDYFQEVVSLISEVMTQAYFGLPGIPVDIAAGPSWGDTIPVENIDGVWTMVEGKHA